MELFACIGLYITSFFDYFSKKQSSKSLGFAGLIQAHTYRLGSKAHQDKLIGFRYLKKAFSLIWSKKENVQSWKINSHKAIFDDALASLPERKSYLEAIEKEGIELFVCKEELGMKTSIFQRIIETLALSTLGLVIIPCTVFYKYRGSLALNLLEVVECARLVQHLRKANIKYVYYFCAFNKDANFVALRLSQLGIYCHKIPSSNPLKNFYQKVIADQFSFTAPFQCREYEGLKQNWRVKVLSNWPVFRFQTIQPLLDNYMNPPSKSLGFISSGIWRRKERGDLALGVGEIEAELILIDFLKSYLPAHSELSFSIFLHPVEKNRPELFEKAKAHYDSVFSEIQVNYFSPEKPSFELFDEVEVTIAAYSSTNLERLYAGFKTLYAPLGMDMNYFGGSEIENIAAFDESQLKKLLDTSMNISTEEFFTRYKLEAYHHNWYRDLFQSRN